MTTDKLDTLAEEILDKYLQDFDWIYWSKENTIKAMQEYAKLYHEEKMKEELIAYSNWTRSEFPPELRFVEKVVDEYLKTRNNGTIS